MKMSFELHDGMGNKMGKLNIVGRAPKWSTYVTMEIDGIDDTNIFIPQKTLEELAVNILKAIKSKHLKS